MDYLAPFLDMLYVVGFPGAVALFLLVTMRKREKTFDERYEKLTTATNGALGKMTDAIHAQTTALAVLAERVA